MIPMPVFNPACSTTLIPGSVSRNLLSLFRLAAEAGRAATTAHSRPQVQGEELDDIQKSQQGDSDAYERLVRRHQEHVGRICWRFTRDPNTHEELVQDVFVEAYLSLRTYRGQSPLEHWLARIATRVGYRFWKKSKRPGAEALQLEDWDRLADSGNSNNPAETAELVHKLLSMLKPKDRLVLTLRYLEGLSIEETADRIGWSRTAVKVQSWRARSKLQQVIQERGIEVEL